MSADDLLETVEGEDAVALDDDIDLKAVLDSPLASPAKKLEEPIKEDENFDDDLFDAAIEPATSDDKSITTSNVKHEPVVSGDASASANASGTVTTTTTTAAAKSSSSTSTVSGKRYCCYVSQMTWWTTDADLQSMIQSCDVSDIIDIRFYENRQNGQSKGYALVVLGSEASVKTLMDKLPTKKIHGQAVQVLGYSKTNLSKLEEGSRKSDTRQRSDQTQQAPNPAAVRLDGTGPPQLTPHVPNMAPTGAASIPGLVGMIRAQQPNNQFSQPPPQIRPQMGPPPQQLANFMNRPPPQMSVAPPPSLVSRGPPNFVQSLTSMGAPPMMQAQNTMNMAMQMPMQNGFPNVNQPAFAMQQFNVPPPQIGMEQPISEQEFEEIMSRNHVVCSSAISRAVSDAANGEYRSAVETLVTAISLIKQSRIAKHDRCKALISSLEGTVRGIESKQYSSRRHRRSRSRSPDRRKRRRRSRSRSHDRYDYSPRRSSRY